MATYLVTVRHSQQTVYEIETDSVDYALTHYKQEGAVVGHSPLSIDTLAIINQDRDEPPFVL